MKSFYAGTDEPVLEPPPCLLDALSDKQREAVNHIVKSGGNGIVWWRIGDGKTRIALTWTFYMVPEPRPLIVCSPGAFRQWQDEIELLGIGEWIKPHFFSYGMLSRKGPPPEVDFEAFNITIVDELWLYKNYKSRRSALVRDFTRAVPAIGLSGSMVTARNIEDLYGQARAMQLDTRVACNITDFRSQYELEIVNRFTKFVERYPKKGAVAAIQRRLAQNVHVHFPRETREIRDIVVNVSPSLEQSKIKRQLTKEYFYAHQDEKSGTFKLEIKSALALIVKLQQISDGIVRDGEGHSLPVDSSKLRRLSELCAELLDSGERVLVWVGFRATANLLRQLLPFPTLLLSSEHQFDAAAWARREADVCVATVGSGASLNDFAGVGYAVFYSTRYSSVQVQQARGRTNRASSVGPRYYYRMATDGFPDRDVFEMIERSNSVEEMVISVTNKIVANTL